MKLSFRGLAFHLLAVTSCAIMPQAFAQTHRIDWFTVDGGGGTSTGGVYCVSGIVGQPDPTGPMAGGGFAVTGGFWSLLSVVQTPGAPLLTISLTSTNSALISWPSCSAGFVLKQNTNLTTTNWISVSGPLNDNGTVKFLVVTQPTGTRYFRLFKP